MERDEKIISGTSTLLKYWIKNYPEDFTYNLQLKKLLSLAETVLEKEDLGQVKIAILKISESKSDQKPRELPISLVSHEDARVIAQCLTLIDKETVNRIKKSELWDGAWESKERDVKSPHVVSLIGRSQIWACWIAKEILECPSLETRVLTLEKFIDVALELRKLNNFQGLHTLLGALNMTPVRRLKSTWAKISKTHLKTFDQLDLLMSPLSNFKAYRQAYANSLAKLGTDGNDGVIPSFSVFLRDLTFIYDGNSVKGRYNVNLMELVGKAIIELKQIQEIEWNSLSAPESLAYFFSTITTDTDTEELYKTSIKLYPTRSSEAKLQKRGRVNSVIGAIDKN